MAKFYGQIGYAESVESSPGVWTDEITEVFYYGDVIRNSRRLEDSSEKLNDDLAVGNSIRIVADAYANEHFFQMKYIEWAGIFWTINTVTVEYPRLVLQLGGVYNGPTAPAPVGP